VVLFGGNSSARTLDETWLWDGTTWAPGPLPPTGLFPRRYHAMAYDSAREQVVLFGGTASTNNNGTLDVNDLWIWDGASWSMGGTPPSALVARSHHTMAYDTARGRVVLTGGLSFATANQTWLYYSRGGGCGVGTECG